MRNSGSLWDLGISFSHAASINYPITVCLMKNAKPLEDQHDLEHNVWSFTEYSPERAAHLYNNWKKCFAASKVHPGVKEAYEQGLRLLEICTGDYENPHYIPVVPDLAIKALKKQWRLDYCRFYHLVTKNTSNRENADSSTSVAAPNPKGGTTSAIDHNVLC